MVKLFRLWLGITEYLFRKPAILEEAIRTAIEDNTFRSDDLEFTFAARVSFLFANHLVLLRLSYCFTLPKRMTSFPLRVTQSHIHRISVGLHINWLTHCSRRDGATASVLAILRAIGIDSRKRSSILHRAFQRPPGSEMR